MIPRIAIPYPTSFDADYNRRNRPAFSQALSEAGAEPVEIPLDATPRRIAELANDCQAILLPGSPADVNPAKYGQARDDATARPDPARENVDELLLQDAHNLYKPILGVCFGMQMLNVWRGGTLLQDLHVMPVNHVAARGAKVAHNVAIPENSLLAAIVDRREAGLHDGFLRLPVNSSHHQAIGIAGDAFSVSARCPQDGVVEAVEGGQHKAAVGAVENHFVLGLQWHPERTLDLSATSRAIFARLVEEAAAWSPRAITASLGA